MKNALFLSLSSIFSKPLPSFLSLFSVVCSITLLCALFLLTNGVKEGFLKNARNIDMVVGDKGSPLQLVLSSVYHMDIPNGNIDIRAMESLKKNHLVKKSVPLAVGDNYKGWRIVGTTTEYLGLYGLKIKQGHIFQKPFDVIAGAATGLDIGAVFSASHGFSAESDDVHADESYRIVGVLERSGTVADKLLLTPYEGVQETHAHHHHHEDQDSHESVEPHDEHEEDFTQQITALLVQVKTPAATMTLPKEINKLSNIQAAVPSYEIARLSKNLGLGEKLVYVLSLGLMGLSVLMLFSSLASSLIARQYDLAVLRVMGATPATLFATLLFEGGFIGVCGAIGGVFIGHIVAYIVVVTTPALQAMMMPWDMFTLHIQDFWLICLGLTAGLLAAVLPARSAMTMNISDLLSKGTL